MNAPGIDVVICTFNGASRLPALFDALAAQTLDSARWRVVLVDNASTDETAEAARRLWPRRDVELVVLSEPKPGQMYAREKARQHLVHPFVCFCDDDNFLSPNYLMVAVEFMENDSAIGALGGRGEAISDVVMPAWLSHAAPGYAVGPQGETEGHVPFSRAFVYGAGMVLRREAWDDLHASGFRSRLAGRVGAGIKSGDDNELCLALALAGWEVHYSPRLTFRHAIPARRLTEEYCRTLYRSFGDALPVLGAYRDFLSGRAKPDDWQRCARMRHWQARLLRLLPTGHGDEALTPSALDREIKAGHRAALRDWKRSDFFTLYEQLAQWIGTVKKEAAR